MEFLNCSKNKQNVFDSYSNDLKNSFLIIEPIVHLGRSFIVKRYYKIRRNYHKRKIGSPQTKTYWIVQKVKNYFFHKRILLKFQLTFFFIFQISENYFLS